MPTYRVITTIFQIFGTETYFTCSHKRNVISSHSHTLSLQCRTYCICCIFLFSILTPSFISPNSPFQIPCPCLLCKPLNPISFAYKYMGVLLCGHSLFHGTPDRDYTHKDLVQFSSHYYQCSSAKGECCMPLTLPSGMLNNLILCNSYFSCHSYHEFISSTVLIFLEFAVLA